VLTPSSLGVQVGSINGLFNLDEVKVFTALDKKCVTHTDFLSAVASIICFYWVSHVAFS